MGNGKTMPSTQTVGLQEARCRREECNRVLCRIRLDGTSQVEIKCPRCKAISIFAPGTVKYRLRPDGQGGYVEVPVSD